MSLGRGQPLHHAYTALGTACDVGSGAYGQEGDGGDVAGLKGELLALLLAMQERLHGLERIQDQQNRAIQARSPTRALVGPCTSHTHTPFRD